MRLRRGLSKARADRLTVGVGMAALGTAGTVLIGELVRLAGRRIRQRTAAEPEAPLHETAGHAIVATGLATQDTLQVARGGYEMTPRAETVLFNMLSGFLGAFSLVRLSTWGIRSGWWPLRDVNIGGRHIHHFVPGILLAFGSGAAAILGDDEHAEQALAVPFGAGIGLTFDEAALLLDLRDVYWTREGVLSVQLSFGVASLLGATILAMRMLRRGERHSEDLGMIPPAPKGATGIWPIVADV